MKILYVTTISRTVNAFLIPHIRMLKEQGHQVDVAFNLEGEVNQELIELGCNVYNIEFQRSVFKKSNLLAYKQIRDLVINENFDIVHTHTPIASFITRLACRKIPNINIYYTAHGFHFFKGSPIKNWITYYTAERLTANWTDKLITMNEEDYTIAKKIMRKENSVFKVHGVGIDFSKFIPQTPELKAGFRSEFGYKKEDFILIYAGELSYRKHQDLVIDAVNLIRTDIPNIKVLLVGNGPLLETFKNQVSRLKLEDNIEFLGYRNDVNKLMLLSDVAISSSRQEGLPVNVMEAMATGLPLVVTNCRGNRDLVIDEKNGYVVDIDDIEEFANAIKKLYFSKTKQMEFKVNGLRLVKSFGLNNVLIEMEKIYWRSEI